MSSITNFDHLAYLRQEAASRGRNSAAFIEFANAVFDGFPKIYQTASDMNARMRELQAGARFDLVYHLYRQIDFSERTFGPGARTQMVLDHIRKELIEIENNPGDVMEWVDVILLALDGAWRSGCSPEYVCHAISEKQERNEHRQWPDWRTSDPDKAIEHHRNDELVEAQGGEA